MAPQEGILVTWIEDVWDWEGGETIWGFDSLVEALACRAWCWQQPKTLAVSVVSVTLLDAVTLDGQGNVITRYPADSAAYQGCQRALYWHPPGKGGERPWLPTEPTRPAGRVKLFTLV